MRFRSVKRNINPTCVVVSDNFLKQCFATRTLVDVTDFLVPIQEDVHGDYVLYVTLVHCYVFYIPGKNRSTLTVRPLMR